MEERGVEERGTAAYIAEFIGTFILVMTITMVVTVWGRPGGVFVVIPLMQAFVLMMLVQTLGNVSGAHLNPAVTIALASIRKIKPADSLIYILLQLSGAILGALFTKAVLLDEGRSISYGATKINESMINVTGGLLIEAMFTFLLVWAIIGVATNPKAARDWAGWVIGATLGMGVMVAAPLTGAGFNPARSFGPALVSGVWTDFWIYIVGPIVGGVVAAVVYYKLFIETHEKTARMPHVE